MCVAIACAIALILYQRKVVAKTGSLAVEADQTHYFGDLAVNIGVVLALLLSSGLGWTLADPLIAIAVAGVMLFTALGVGRQSFHQLMDRELPDAERARICRIAQSHEAVKNVHDLKTRMAGPVHFIQVHLGLDPKMSLAEAHAISDAVEAALQSLSRRGGDHSPGPGGAGAAARSSELRLASPDQIPSPAGQRGYRVIIPKCFIARRWARRASRKKIGLASSDMAITAMASLWPAGLSVPAVSPARR